MKTFTFAVVSVAASIAFAFPAVKDKAVFQGKVEGAAGGQIDFTQTLELVAIDAATGKAKVSVNITQPNGQSQNQMLDLNLSDLMTRAQAQDILAKCTTYGGVSGQTTVPAGTFATCELKQDNGGLIYVAEVPFGFVKQVGLDEDQNKISAELSSFNFGQ